MGKSGLCIQRSRAQPGGRLHPACRSRAAETACDPAAFSFKRIVAILVKEFIQMRRDRMTFALMIGIPVMQLLLFGFAINSDPKHLPTAVAISDPGTFCQFDRRGVGELRLFRHRRWRRIRRQKPTHAGGRRGRLSSSKFPANFCRDLVRGAQPTLLVEADATDPAAASNAVGALGNIAAGALRDDLIGPLAQRAQAAPRSNGRASALQSRRQSRNTTSCRACSASS